MHWMANPVRGFMGAMVRRQVLAVPAGVCVCGVCACGGDTTFSDMQTGMHEFRRDILPHFAGANQWQLIAIGVVVGVVIGLYASYFQADLGALCSWCGVDKPSPQSYSQRSPRFWPLRGCVAPIDIPVCRRQRIQVCGRIRPPVEARRRVASCWCVWHVHDLHLGIRVRGMLRYLSAAQGSIDEPRRRCACVLHLTYVLVSVSPFTTGTSRSCLFTWWELSPSPSPSRATTATTYPLAPRSPSHRQRHSCPWPGTAAAVALATAALPTSGVLCPPPKAPCWPSRQLVPSATRFPWRRLEVLRVCMLCVYVVCVCCVHISSTSYVSWGAIVPSCKSLVASYFDMHLLPSNSLSITFRQVSHAHRVLPLHLVATKVHVNGVSNKMP